MSQVLTSALLLCIIAVGCGGDTRRLNVLIIGVDTLKPDPPYTLVWHVEGRYGREIPADLGEDVKKDLHALGRIQ